MESGEPRDTNDDAPDDDAGATTGGRPPRRRRVRADGPSDTPPAPRSSRGRGRGQAQNQGQGQDRAVAGPANPPLPLPGPAAAPSARWPHAPMSWPREEAFTEPWMKPWLEAAAASLSVADACRVVGIGLSQYLMGRRRDLAFDEAALVLDQIVDLMIIESVRLGALDSDMQAVRIYFQSVRLPAFIPRFVSWSRSAPKGPAQDEALPPHVYEAMIAAGLAAMEQPPPEDDDDD